MYRTLVLSVSLSLLARYPYPVTYQPAIAEIYDKNTTIHNVFKFVRRTAVYKATIVFPVRVGVSHGFRFWFTFCFGLVFQGRKHSHWSLVRCALSVEVFQVSRLKYVCCTNVPYRFIIKVVKNCVMALNKDV